jgi:hypothetical protein
MRTKKCLMCQGEHFYSGRLETTGSLGNGEVSIQLGIFHNVPVDCTVCLTCGFVAPYVDHGGLVAIRETARKQGVEIGGGEE